MKRIILTLAIVFPMIVLGQDVNQNWVKRSVYKTPSTTPLGTDPADAMIDVTYIDGLGRTVQKTENQQSASGKDISVHLEYDAFGRQVKNFLPYATGDAGMTFDATDAGPMGYAEYDGNKPYSETEYDGSPLNRIVKVAAPGTTVNWAMGSGHEVRFSYETNVHDEVRKFTNIDGEFSDEGFYADGVLYKEVATDENGHDTETCKNARGQLIRKRVFVEGEDPYDTYYVYDEYDNLVLVIPPKANGEIDATIIENLCYQYTYDAYNRLIMKQLPGKRPEYIVYDKLNRIVGTGPVLSPFGSTTDPPTQGWLRTYYDASNRVAFTGWSQVLGTFDNLTRKSLQNGNNAGVTNAAKTASPISVNYVQINYAVNNLPAGFILLTVNYYDDYSFPHGTIDFNGQIEEQDVYYNETRKPIGMVTGSWVRVPDNPANTDVKGETTYILYDKWARPIATHEKNYLGGYTDSDSRLDFSGKVLNIMVFHKRDAAQTADMRTNDVFNYTEQGRLLNHDKILGNSVQLLSRNTYSELGRLINKRVGGEEGQPVLQSIDYKYNIRGWLTDINDVKDAFPTQDRRLFAYKINYDRLSGDEDEPGPISARYNGSISETLWRTTSDNVLRYYGYNYDETGRITNAIYSKPDAGITHSYDENVSYDRNGNITTLDRNGNLDDIGQTLQIDNLTYHYPDNSNRLKMVYDSTNSTLGFRDNANATANDSIDYDYDDYGNVTKDNNKGINYIHYNHLNLPVEIGFSTGVITYLYDAAGTKLKKTVTFSTATRTTDYLDQFQYYENKLKFIQTSEGYVSCTAIRDEITDYNYVFNYLDQLGNVRLSYGLNEKNELKIIEENHYYPYGLKHTNYNPNIKIFDKKPEEGDGVILKQPDPSPGDDKEKVNDYKFNGMEWQDELGLNLYDMDMREYDPAIGRWTGIDPVTHHSMSPYVGMDNNPVSIADPSGADGVMDLFNSAGNGVTTFSGNGNEGFKQTSFESEEEIIQNAKNGPGALFSSELGAAVGFAMTYNALSYQRSQTTIQEIGSAIYSKGAGADKTYSYVEPEMCGGMCGDADMKTIVNKVKDIQGATAEAFIHTHGGETDKKVINGTRAPWNNGFSDEDIYLSRHNLFNKPMKVYLAAPDGALRLYDPSVNYNKFYLDGIHREGYNVPVYYGLPFDNRTPAQYRQLVRPKKIKL